MPASLPIAKYSRSAVGVEVAAAAQFQTPDGYMVTVRWGDASPYGPADAQAMVNFPLEPHTWARAGVDLDRDTLKP